MTAFFLLHWVLSAASSTCAHPRWRVYSEHYSAYAGCASARPPGADTRRPPPPPPLAGVVPFLRGFAFRIGPAESAVVAERDFRYPARVRLYPHIRSSSTEHAVAMARCRLRRAGWAHGLNHRNSDRNSRADRRRRHCAMTSIASPRRRAWTSFMRPSRPAARSGRARPRCCSTARLRCGARSGRCHGVAASFWSVRRNPAPPISRPRSPSAHSRSSPCRPRTVT